jgi:uncharacterized membrane protein
VSASQTDQEVTVNIQRGHRLVALLLLLVAGCTIQTDEVPDAVPGLEPSPFFGPVADAVATGIEIVGIGVIVIGAVLASVVFAREWIGEPKFLDAYRRYRERLGQAILLGLEFLVAADIIGTVAVRPTFRNVGILGAIIVIRTFLSFALEVEIQGNWPWESGKG